MSCLIFQKGYYKQLERKSKLANALFFHCRNGAGIDLQTTLLGDFLFELNAEAYAIRYSHHDDTPAIIEACRADVSDDYMSDDEVFGKVNDWESLPHIWRLLDRIKYQCEEFPDNHPAEPRLRVLRWMVEKAVDLQMEKLFAAIEAGRILKDDYCYDHNNRGRSI